MLNNFKHTFDNINFKNLQWLPHLKEFNNRRNNGLLPLLIYLSGILIFLAFFISFPHFFAKWLIILVGIVTLLFPLTFAIRKKYLTFSSICSLIQYMKIDSPQEDYDVIDQEVQKILALIKSDFVLSWFDEISDNSEVPDLSDQILTSVSNNLVERIKCINLMSLITESVKDAVCILNVQKIMNSQRANFTDKQFVKELVKHFESIDLSEEKLDLELRTSLKPLLSRMLYCLLDYNHYQCSVGRELFLEILQQNVIIPLINLISDPVHLFPLLIFILVDEEALEYCQKLQLLIDNNYNHVVERGNSVRELNKKSTDSAGLQTVDITEKIPHRLTVSSANSFDSSVYTPSDSEPSNLFVDLEISATEQVKEAFSDQIYTLYVIRYYAWHDNPDDDRIELRQSIVRRRHREFVCLQSRLENALYYKDSLRGIRAPTKFMQLPFINRTKSKIEQRRIYLERYLQHLIDRPELCMSVELKGFLAYESDPSIAFTQPVKSAMPKVLLEKTASRIGGVFEEVMDAVTGSVQSGTPLTLQQVSVVEKHLEESFEDEPKPLESSLQDLRFVTPASREQTFLDKMAVTLEHQRSVQLSLQWSISQLSFELHPESRMSYNQESGELSSLVLHILANSVHSASVTGGLLQPKLLGFFNETGSALLDFWLQYQVQKLSETGQVAIFLRSGRNAIWSEEPQLEPLELPVLQMALEEAFLEFFPAWLVKLLGHDRLRAVFRHLIETFSCECVNKILVIRFFHRLFGEVFPEIKDDSEI